MASETAIPGNLGQQVPTSSTEGSETKNSDEGQNKTNDTATKAPASPAARQAGGSTTDDGVRQRLVAASAPASQTSALGSQQQPQARPATNPMPQPRHPAQAQPPRQVQPPMFQINQNQMAYAFLTVISILLAVLFAFLFIQFRNEYRLSQLSKLSPSPFLKLKNSLTGIPSQPPTRKFHTRYEKPKVPEPEPDEAPDPDRFRATAQTKDKYPFLKDDPKRALKPRGVDPEYEAYAQQLQAVLGNLKEAVKRIDSSANITEIAGLVKMKPNKKPDEKERVIKIEDEHTRMLIDDDEDGENTVPGPDHPGKLRMDGDANGENGLAGVLGSAKKSADGVRYERIADYIKNHKTSLGQDDISEEEVQQHVEKLAKKIEEKEFQETKEYLESFIKADDAANAESANADDQSSSSASDPYDDIMTYRKTKSKWDQKLIDELEDRMVEGKGDRDVSQIMKDMNARKRERVKLMDRLVEFYLQSLGEEEREEVREEYESIISAEESKSQFQQRLQDTLFGALEDGYGDEDEDYEDLDEPKPNAVYDERLDGDIAEDAKELLDSIPETERDWIYNSLKLERKIERDIRHKMIHNILEDSRKESEEAKEKEEKTQEIQAE